MPAKARKARASTSSRLRIGAGARTSAPAFARRIVETLGTGDDSVATTVVFTAHSLPRVIVDAGDAYEREARSAADAVGALVSADVEGVRTTVAFQSQGSSRRGQAGVRSSGWGRT